MMMLRYYLIKKERERESESETKRERVRHEYVK